MRLKTAWMFEPMKEDNFDEEKSDFETIKQDEIIQVRNKAFRIK